MVFRVDDFAAGSKQGFTQSSRTDGEEEGPQTEAAFEKAKRRNSLKSGI